MKPSRTPSRSARKPRASTGALSPKRGSTTRRLVRSCRKVRSNPGSSMEYVEEAQQALWDAFSRFSDLAGTDAPVPPGPAQRDISQGPKGDQDVQVHVEGKVYRIKRTLLEGHSEYFAQLFSSTGAVENREDQRQGGVCGPVVYSAPAEVTAPDFELLLEAIKAHDGTVISVLSTDSAASLLRVAHALSCGFVIQAAKQRLCALWEAERLPKAESYQTGQIARKASSTSVPDDSPRHYAEALTALRVAREFDLPSMVKRAAYELVCSEAFWAAVQADRASVDIAEDDLARLVALRTHLRALWNRALRYPPRTDTTGRRVKFSCHGLLRNFGKACKAVQDDTRMKEWSKVLAGQQEAGARDPLRYDIFARMTKGQRDGWCSCCVREWETELLHQRREWWASGMDAYLA